VTTISTLLKKGKNLKRICVTHHLGYKGIGVFYNAEDMSPAERNVDVLLMRLVDGLKN
jgi:hypothetical protein